MAVELMSDSLREKFVSYLKCTDINQLVFEFKKPDPDSLVDEETKKKQSCVKFCELYEFQSVLGAGGFGFVLRCVCQKT